MYSIMHDLQVLTNQVVCWKYLIVMHKVLRSGHKEVRIRNFCEFQFKAIRYVPKKVSVFEEIKRTWVI